MYSNGGVLGLFNVWLLSAWAAVVLNGETIGCYSCESKEEDTMFPRTNRVFDRVAVYTGFNWMVYISVFLKMSIYLLGISEEEKNGA